MITIPRLYCRINSHSILTNYPNPFDSSIKIRYYIPFNDFVRLNVYNILGQKVINLVADETVKGLHSVYRDGTDRSGHKVASGIYLCRMKAGNYIRTNKMLLLR
ncbi:MAG TPA: T9SS type A sorting domain-containing protein [candidate division Zixibacteria bacterium]|nr:T9SS type A sorting domain-containing protein [candidate division Zixibacteria bacterium]